MPSVEGLRLKMRNNIYIPLTCKLKNKKLLNKEFTIISNNCWGGTVYEAYNLQKQSPTVGMFFMADDYIKFISNLEEYLQAELQFINPLETKWKSFVEKDQRFGHYPVGRLNDIELHFLHYHNEEEAMEKWKRRIRRINWEHLLIKFNDQNGCTERNLREFCKLPYKNRIYFTCKDWGIQDDVIKKIHQSSREDHILASYEPFGKTKEIDITEVLNSL